MEVTIRLPDLNDAQALVNLKRGYIKNTTTLPLTIDDYPDDPSKEAGIIQDYLDSSNSVLLLADVDGELIGNIDLTGNKRSKLAHTAMLGMGIKEGWRNQGLGKCLIESAIHWAKNDSPLEVIWLDVYASNELGYNLYKNTGFTVSGVIKDFFKTEGGYVDKVQMYILLRM